jgi:hypothetical protein
LRQENAATIQRRHSQKPQLPVNAVNQIATNGFVWRRARQLARRSSGDFHIACHLHGGNRLYKDVGAAESSALV